MHPFLLSSFDALPPAAVSSVSHLAHHQPFINLVVTNVPGPELPLYVLGARMLEAVPWYHWAATSARGWRRSPTTAS